MNLSSYLRFEDFTETLDGVIFTGSSMCLIIMVSLSALLIAAKWFINVVSLKFIDGNETMPPWLSLYDIARLLCLAICIASFPALKGTIKGATNTIISIYDVPAAQKEKMYTRYEQHIAKKAIARREDEITSKYVKVNRQISDQKAAAMKAYGMSDPKMVEYIETKEKNAIENVQANYDERMKDLSKEEGDIMELGLSEYTDGKQNAALAEEDPSWTDISENLKNAAVDGTTWILDKVRGAINFLCALFITYSLGVLYALGPLAFAISVFFKSAWLSWFKAICATALALAVLSIIDVLAGIDMQALTSSDGDDFLVAILHPILIIALYLKARSFIAIVFNSSGVAIGGSAGTVVSSMFIGALAAKSLVGASWQGAKKNAKRARGAWRKFNNSDKGEA